MRIFNRAEITLILDVWNHAKTKMDFTQRFGSITMTDMLNRHPQCQTYFGSTLENHVNVLAVFLESLFDMLGPDVTAPGNYLRQIGEKHKHLHLRSIYFVWLGQSMLVALESINGYETSVVEKEQWEDLCDTFMYDIVRWME